MYRERLFMFFNIHENPSEPVFFFFFTILYTFFPRPIYTPSPAVLFQRYSTYALCQISRRASYALYIGIIIIIIYPFIFFQKRLNRLNRRKTAVSYNTGFFFSTEKKKNTTDAT